MLHAEKATYSRLALNEGLKQLKAVHLTAARKNCYYPIYSDLNAANNFLEDYAGNRFAFHSYHLEEYKERLYNHFKDTSKADFSRLARLAKRDLLENVLAVLREAEAGNVNLV